MVMLRVYRERGRNAATLNTTTTTTTKKTEKGKRITDRMQDKMVKWLTSAANSMNE